MTTKRYLSIFASSITILILFFAPLSAQEKPAYVYLMNQKYIQDPADNYQDSICTLDLYYPDKQTGFPTVVWFHGGGLKGGKKEIPGELKNKGIAVAGVGYRLAPRAKNPDYIRDAAAAVAWVIKNISRYGGDSTKVVLSGHSAGGYLSLMAGMDSKWLAAHGIDNNLLAALIPLSPQCITHFTIRGENKIPELQPTVDEYAPLYHVTAKTPEIVLITGDRETELFGRYEENAYMEKMLKLNGRTDVSLYELDGFDHGEMARPGSLLLANIVKKKFGIK